MGRRKGHTVDDYIAAARAGMTMSEAASAMKVSHQAVFWMASKYKIAFTKGSAGRPRKVIDKEIDNVQA